MGNSNGKPIVLTDEVNLNHFRLLRVVGKGAFGKVRIVERRDTGLTFALKYIRKDEVVRSESVRNIIRERRMLEHLNHPFLCNLRYSFQDVEYLYIVVDLMTGGDLRFHISRKSFTEPAVRFWISELACALRYIHQQGIVHRDVKPDNILLDATGHVHLADFNVASELPSNRQLTSRSGTLAYLAPEVYAGRGYSSEVDWWSLGVVFYECIYNRRPFDGYNRSGKHLHNSPEMMAQAILRGEANFPNTNPPVSPNCKSAMSSLLEKDRSIRIGAAGFSTFTKHPFFSEVDFEALERREIEPVFCPASDKTNFDATYDLEELLLEEAPLEARSRKQKPRAELRDDATRDEIRADELHRMIETMFEPFDYTTLPAERTPSAIGAERGHGGTSATTTPAEAGASSSSSSQQPSVPLPTPIRPPSPRSNNQSPDGSPPLCAGPLPPSEYFNAPIPKSDPSSTPAIPRTTATSPQNQLQNSLARALPWRGRGSSGNFGVSGGLQLFPHDRGQQKQNSGTSVGDAASAQAVAGASTTNFPSPPIGALPEDSPPNRRGDRPSGMLGFLSRKKGRDGSPKGKEKERGVLGKEGARVTITGP